MNVFEVQKYNPYHGYSFATKEMQYNNCKVKLNLNYGVLTLNDYSEQIILTEKSDIIIFNNNLYLLDNTLELM